MFTRSEYMNNKCTHDTYFSQFVNDKVKARVLLVVGKKRLLKSKDPYLNDIPMKLWDGMGGFAFCGSKIIMSPTSIEPVDYSLMRKAGEGVSACTMVCIYKNAARQIIEEMK